MGFNIISLSRKDTEHLVIFHDINVEAKVHHIEAYAMRIIYNDYYAVWVSTLIYMIINIQISTYRYNRI